MDPNEALKRLRKYASDTGGEFGETFEGLDRWLSNGGFLPIDWTRAGENNRLIRPFDVLLCDTCDTDREVATVIDGVIRFRVCGHVQP
jgi:hypothetical protein